MNNNSDRDDTASTSSEQLEEAEAQGVVDDHDDERIDEGKAGDEEEEDVERVPDDEEEEDLEAVADGEEEGGTGQNSEDEELGQAPTPQEEQGQEEREKEEEGGGDDSNSGEGGDSGESEYEEDVFAEDGRDEMGNSFKFRTPSSPDEVDEYNKDKSNHSGQTAGSVCTFVSPKVWAQTWEERARLFQEEHPEEYKDIQKQMKQREVDVIELEREQRLHENRIDRNVKFFVRTVGGALCAFVCLTVLLCIILAVMKTGHDGPNPIPTAPPLGAPIAVAPTVAPGPTTTTAHTPTMTPVVIAIESNTTLTGTAV